MIKIFKCLILLSFLSTSIFGAENKKPNIILLLIDDMGFGDIAAHGNPLVKTPNFDRMHDESLRFTDFLVSPTCSPTRAALLSGMHELKVGISHTIPGRCSMNTDAVLIPHVLKKAGYHTAMFGKWHLGFDEEKYRPHKRGFDLAVNDQKDDQKSHYDPVLIRNGVTESTKGYRTDILFNEAMKYIENQVQKKQPFFCYLATYSPHTPLKVPANYTKPYEGKSAKPNFHGMVANVDENLGRLLNKLDRLGITDNTLLIAMGDNGATFGVDTWNAGMRGVKAKAYYGAVRTFSFWRWPASINKGNRTQLTCHHDVLPTLASIAGVELGNSHREKLDGLSLTPLFKKSQKWSGDDRMVVHHATRWPDNKAEEHKYKYCGVRWKKYHLVRQHPCDDPNCVNAKASVCRLDIMRMKDSSMPGFYGNMQHYKLTEPGKWSLFNLKEDPHEDRNIADSKKDIVQKMVLHFDKWWEEVNN